MGMFLGTVLMSASTTLRASPAGIEVVSVFVVASSPRVAWVCAVCGVWCRGAPSSLAWVCIVLRRVSAVTVVETRCALVYVFRAFRNAAASSNQACDVTIYSKLLHMLYVCSACVRLQRVVVSSTARRRRRRSRNLLVAGVYCGINSQKFQTPCIYICCMIQPPQSDGWYTRFEKNAPGPRA